MGIKTGLGGSVDGQHTVRNWQVTETSENKDYGASNTRKGTGRKAGPKDWSGSFEAYRSSVTLMPGDKFNFTGHGIEEVSGPAIVDSIEVSCPIEDGDPISLTVNFSGDGELTKQAGTGDDETVPDPPSAIGCKIEIGATPVEVSDVRSWSLTMSADNKEYRSSSTGGWTKREAGRLDIEGSYEVYADDSTDLPDTGSFTPILLYVGATDHYEIKWAAISQVEPSVDAETGDIVGATISWEWSGFLEGDAGEVKLPGVAEAVWPESSE